MKTINKVIALALAALLFTFTLVGCSGGADEDLIAIQPEYVGEDVYDTQHTFKKSDFELTAIYKNNVSRKVTDFKYEVEGMKSGVYIVNFEYGGQENSLFIECKFDFFSGEGN